jgi:hypothetical protein
MQFSSCESRIFSLTFACWGDKLFEIIFRSFHAFFGLWNAAAISDTNHFAGTHNSGSYKRMNIQPYIVGYVRISNPYYIL